MSLPSTYTGMAQMSERPLPEASGVGFVQYISPSPSFDASLYHVDCRASYSTISIVRVSASTSMPEDSRQK